MTKRNAEKPRRSDEEPETTSDTSETPKPAEGQDSAPKTGRERSLENLTKAGKNRELSTEEAQRIGSKGGKRSVQKRRERKSFQEALQIGLTMPMHAGKVTPIDKVKTFDDTKDANLTVSDRIVLKLLQKAANGDLKAIDIIRDQIGESRPKQVEATVKIHDEQKLREMKKRIDQDPDLLNALLGVDDDSRAHRRGAPGPSLDLPPRPMGR